MIGAALGYRVILTMPETMSLERRKILSGLGAEIAKEPFRQQFSGLILAAEGQPIGIRRPDASLGKNEVHAVTGATQTSTRLEKIINSALQQWRDKMEGIAVEKQE
ncbi:MAG: O-acetylserine sulfhydrylase [Planctomycetes bacterium ADurb.Bin412]|nr:MAG: O-acetylserine sulfhydrylase [Planctomycetes bacterium ADurb.Bin412]